MKRDSRVRNFLFFECRLLVASGRVGVLLISLLCLVTSPGKAQDVLWGLTANFGPQGAGTVFSMQSSGAGFNLHKSFVNPPVHPQGSLVLGRDGNLYGMTTQGGSFRGGTVFMTTATGVGFQVLKSLDRNDGSNPLGSLVPGTDGFLYGMTPFGGSFTQGTLFRIATNGTGLTVLKNFGYDDGANPLGSLVQGKDGNLYGMTQAGGSAGGGTVFRISATGANFEVIKNLAYTADGAFPRGSLVQATDGYFYGMTQTGGSEGYGTLFKLGATGAGFAVLKNFAYTDGANPQGSLVSGPDGNLYGMTSQGGSHGYGTLFKISATGKDFAVLKNFDKATDGGHPFGSLVLGKDGSFYGLTQAGGRFDGGTVFKMDAAGTGFTVLKNLAYPDGTNPQGSLVPGTDGNFYGMTYQGGSTGAGTVFKISPDGTGFSVINNLGTTDGAFPLGSLVPGPEGSFYGLTQAGGSSGGGTVFKIGPDGMGYKVLKSFDAFPDGASPRGSLVPGKDGYFYGMTYAGGSFSQGTVFKIAPTGTGFVVLKHFAYSDGANPSGSLVQGPDGNFYGMTANGGSTGYGTVFKIGPTGENFAVLKNFEYDKDGGNPAGSLVPGPDGYLYGLTYQGGSNDQGTVFKVGPTGKGFVVLKHFAFTDGANPSGSLVQGTEGNFYGLTVNGGSGGYGTVFAIGATGAGFAVLKSFDYANGAFPAGDLVPGTDGAFFGMTYQGGSFGGGTVFTIGATGAGFKVLKSFSSSSDGVNPSGSLVLQKNLCKPPRKIAVTGPAAPVAIHTPISLKVTYLGNADIAAIKWGDGTPVQDVSHPGNTFDTPTHTYREAGVYTIKISLTGCNARKHYLYKDLVVYDPNGGLVLGGGWISSPAGAYSADPELTGKAYFGFVAKYQREATVPTGITEFRFPAAGLTFSSSSYDWLVISGSKARFKGKGTLNGAGGYAFLLSGVDGDRIAAQSPDRLRIKIWNTTTHTLVYDNQIGEADNAAANTEITRGAIVIHPAEKEARVAYEPEKSIGPANLKAYPNPFQTKITVAFSLGEDEDFTLDVYDLKGSLVKHLQEGNAKAGNLLQVSWEPGRLPPGVYLIRLKTLNGIQQLRTVLE